VILYVNGDSHSAGAEAVNSYCFANDDPLYHALGRRPHPDNERVSYGCNIANELNAILHCDAESASSNTRIVRTTKDYLAQNRPDFIVIGWATWEREEWLFDDIYYQITGSGTDKLPKELVSKYKEWVVTSALDRAKNELHNHETIWEFHLWLNNLGIKHLFFNTYNCFAHIRNNDLPRKDWNDSYLYPYDEQYTYFNWLKNNNCNTVNNGSYHFGADAHRKWAEFLLPHLTKLL
jgi:hypothetical protein